MLSRSTVIGSALFFRKEVKTMFEDRSREAYRKAAEAVQNGTADSAQKAMNDRAARYVGKYWATMLGLHRRESSSLTRF